MSTNPGATSSAQSTATTPASIAGAGIPAGAGPERSNLRRPWLVKMGIFFIVLVLFGLYSLYDATVAYPARGRRVAEYREWEYLQAVRDADASLLNASVKDPAGELARVNAIEDAQIGARDLALRNWLRALSVISSLRPEATTYASSVVAEDRLAQLQREWTSGSAGKKDAPKPLAAYDIAIQWLFLFIGFGFALYLVVLFVRVRARVFTWEAGARRLGMPGGVSVTPEDLEDVDKRKWDKYLVFLKIKAAHPKLGGREVRLDLYRHGKLEEWVLEMERAAFPDRAQPVAPAEAPAPESAPEPASPTPG